MPITLPTISFTTTVPEMARVGGRQAGENVYQNFMIDMPAPTPGKGKNAPMQFAWFFVEADAPPDTITDTTERDKATKVNCQKLVNRFTSVARRIRKKNADTHDFTFRKARDPSVADGTGAWGLTVYRIEPGNNKGGPGSAAKNAPAT